MKDTIKLNTSELKVHGFQWSDKDVAANAVLIAIHGGVQHAGVYSALAEKLAEKGVVVYSVDLRGHGKWQGDSSKTAKVNYQASTRDVVALVKQLRRQYPALPVYAAGESLGAATLLHAVTIEPKLFDGMILASPGTSPNMSHAWAAVLKSVGQGVSTLGTSIDLTGHVRRISEDPRSCDEMINDPDNRNKATVLELIEAAHFVKQNRALARRVDRTVPILMLEGGNDQICSTKSMESLFKLFQSEDKSLNRFEGNGHLILTTMYLKPEVVATVSEWLAQRTARYSSSAVSLQPTNNHIEHSGVDRPGLDH